MDTDPTTVQFSLVAQDQEARHLLPQETSFSQASTLPWTPDVTTDVAPIEFSLLETHTGHGDPPVADPSPVSAGYGYEPA
jgi:hypothetical protein